ncbi:hypothetical protein [Azospirillum melinis]
MSRKLLKATLWIIRLVSLAKFAVDVINYSPSTATGVRS